MARKKPAPPVQRDLFGDPVEDQPGGRRDVVPLDFESHAVRMMIIRGVPWWYLVDVCRCLTIGNTTDAAGRLDDDERMTLDTIEGHSGQRGGAQSVLLINEAGLYSLILTSRKPEAKRFKRWLTHEVLPAIRRTGSYSLPTADTRVKRTAKRLRCDLETAGKRVEVADHNKTAVARILGDGGGTYHVVAYHNAAYRGQFGMDAGDLRRELGIRPSATPLDRMAWLPLMQHGHSKALAEVAFRSRAEAGDPVPLRDQAAILEEIAAEHKRADMERLGPGHAYAVVEDPARGKVIDVVQFKTLGAVA